MTAKEEIIKSILNMSGSYTPYNIFSDWVQLCALTIQNSVQIIHDEIWQQRESLYIDIIKKYDSREQKTMSHMYGMLQEAFENEISDILGEIYMESGCGSKHTGQFFTPFHISVLCAEVRIPKEINEHERFRVSEPSAGGGGMIIALAKVLKDRGINYQRCMDVVAQDLDWNGVYMTYVQLSILGIKATVVQGDTLANPYKDGLYPPERIFRTPGKMGLII